MTAADIGKDKNGLWARWKERVAGLKAETLALSLAAKDSRVPWYAKVLAAAVAAYLFCPFDLIPDFIPVLGALDDLILVPLGLWLAIRLIPPPVMADCRMRAREAMVGPGSLLSRSAGIAVILIWLLAGAGVGWMVCKDF